MDKSWFRIILTWVVIIPDLILSYHSLRNPYTSLEITSLAINFIATTVLYYVYMDINAEPAAEEEEGGSSSKSSEEPSSTFGLYKMNFGSLIEDMLVWTGLFFILYNIVPVSLYVHNIIAKQI